MTQHKSERNNNRKTTVIVMFLLALVALLCFGGYTFSKYVTSSKGSGTASVAKWGYTASVDTAKLFGEEYKYDAAKAASTVDGTGAKLTVKADTTGRNLVAPGTAGSMAFTVGGQAEVRARLHMSLTPTKDVVLKIKKTTDTAYTEYNPVKWTLKKNGAVVTGAENVTFAVIAELVTHDTAVSVSGDYEANAVLAKTTYEISWAWAFEGAGDVAGLTIDQADTILGQMANGATGYTPAGYVIDAANSSTELEFDLIIQVSQLDK